MQFTFTTGGGPTAGTVGVGVGVPGTGVADGVGVGALNLMTTGVDPDLHWVTLQAVISIRALVSCVNDVENAVEPGGTGAGKPLMLHLVVVDVPVTVPVQVTAALTGLGV
jgi:hypothetical protein